MSARPQGPNVRRLIAHRMSVLLVPPGTGNAVGTAVANLVRPGNVGAAVREATAWVEAALQAVRGAADPNPWRHATDEAIAAEVLRQIDERAGTAGAAAPRGKGAP